MGMLGDLATALEKIELWKRLKPIPERVVELERRIEQLEARLGAASAGGLGTCPLCGSMQFKRTASKPDPTFGDFGVKQDSYRCLSCGHTEDRQRDEGAR